MIRYRGQSKESVDPSSLTGIFEKAEQFPEIANKDDYEWTLIRGVPLKKFSYSSREDYEMDPDLTEEEAQENLDRIDKIQERWNAGEPIWPIVVDVQGNVIDGYHRLTAADEFGTERVDVLVPKLAQKR